MAPHDRTEADGAAAGLLALLDEPEAAVQAHALTSINRLIHSFWPEVAEAIETMFVPHCLGLREASVACHRRAIALTTPSLHSETLSERQDFPARQLASLVASKVYYHLGSLDEALTYALGAGKLFDLAKSDGDDATDAEYVQTVIGTLHSLGRMQGF